MPRNVLPYVEVMFKWKSLFEGVADFPVMGASESQLAALRMPTIVIPGNDLTHSSSSAHAAHQLIEGSELHQLPVVDQDEPLIPYTEWGHLEEEIADTLLLFMRRH